MVPHPASAPGTVPASAEPDFVLSPLSGLVGFLGFVAGVFWLNVFGPVFLLIRPWEGLIVMAFTAVPMLVCDRILLQRRARATAPDAPARPPHYSLERTLIKLIGLGASVVVVAFFYWVFPEYRPSFRPDSGFYSNFFILCRLAGPWAALLCAVYFYLIDARLQDPHDGYWHFGRVVLLNWHGVDWGKVSNHLRTWAVKGFFMPLMFTYLCDNLPGLLYHGWPDFLTAFNYLHNFLFTIDLAFVSCGYVLTLRWVQSHVRSAEPTALGWTAALICYQPLWGTVGNLYLGYWSDRPWDSWLPHSNALFYAWGCAILCFEAIFVWATVVFGLRFSNLTHRGIVSFGPYRFTKHPAYISKICAFLLLSAPWMDTRGFEQQCRDALMLGGLGFVYWIRARTEERHLSSIDPAYSMYAREVRERHRRWFGAILGPLAPKPRSPDQPSGA